MPALVLFRNDLRLNDNPALAHALAQGKRVLALFIYEDHYDNGDENSFEKLGSATKLWLHYSLSSLAEDLRALGSRLIICRGSQLEVLNKILAINSASIASVYWNRRYEPHHIKLDAALKDSLNQQNIEAKSFSSSLLIEPWEILNKQSKPYQVYTPFSKQYFSLLESSMLEKTRPLAYKLSPENFMSSEDLDSLLESSQSELLGDFKKKYLVNHINDLNLRVEHAWTEKMTKYIKAGESEAKKSLASFVSADSVLAYKAKRDYPSIRGTSQLSTHLHFGEISPRQIYSEVDKLNSALKYDYLKQIIWREFAHHLMYHFPYTVNQPLKKEFTRFKWRDLNEENALLLKKWQRGETGYPIVDAGMKELWETGWMHNRVRMISASFLVKDLRMHWLEGARWFWDTLFDADLANNTMGWQWVAGTGADAAPYFRIFNPVTQSERFDAEAKYIRHWLPALNSFTNKQIHLPRNPVVDHDIERKLALAEFKNLAQETV